MYPPEVLVVAVWVSLRLGVDEPDFGAGDHGAGAVSDIPRERSGRGLRVQSNSQRANKGETET